MIVKEYCEEIKFVCTSVAVSSSIYGIVTPGGLVLSCSIVVWLYVLLLLYTRPPPLVRIDTVFVVSRKEQCRPSPTSPSAVSAHRVSDSCHFPPPSVCKHTHEGVCADVIMQAQLAEYYRHGLNLVLTSEVLGILFAQPSRGQPKLRDWFQDVLGRNDWDVRMYFGYRP